MAELRFGTCSWKYPSWEGLVYSASKGINYLKEYSQKYDTVEIDQWFWSLFERGAPVLPGPADVVQYTSSVPENFRFSIKVPNSITLTHFYRKDKKVPLVSNPHFLSTALFQEFLSRLEPMHRHLGPLMFQFEYLNRQKMPSQTEFQRRFSLFLDAVPRDFPLALEIRNPNYLNPSYFGYLLKNEVSPVLMQGYYMPSILDTFAAHEEAILAQKLVVVRLHGPDRAGMEMKSRKVWNEIIAPKDDDLAGSADMISKIRSAGGGVYVNVNNHYEGSSPLTIERLRKLI